MKAITDKDAAFADQAFEIINAVKEAKVGAATRNSRNNWERPLSHQGDGKGPLPIIGIASAGAGGQDLVHHRS